MQERRSPNTKQILVAGGIGLLVLLAASNAARSTKGLPANTTQSETRHSGSYVSTPVVPVVVKPEPGAQWSYFSNDDKMGRKKSFAQVTSNNTLSFDFPYRGPQNGTLTIRRSGQWGTEATVSIERGQFLCRFDGCSVNVQYDGGPVWEYAVTGPADHSTTTLFINEAPEFVSCVRKARVVRIEATFFQQGTQIMEFNVEGFKWPIPK